MLEAKLEGASTFREVCKIICNILTITYQDEDVNEDDPQDEENNFLAKIQIFEKFCNFTDLAHVYMSLIKQLLEKSYSFLKEVNIFLFENISLKIIEFIYQKATMVSSNYFGHNSVDAFVFCESNLFTESCFTCNKEHVFGKRFELKLTFNFEIYFWKII